MRDENDTTTGDLLNSPVGPVLPTVTVEGWGTGTVAELEHHVAQLRDERDAARHALADLERRTNSPDAIDGAELVATIARIAERVAERVALRVAESVAFSDSEIDGDAIWAEIEYRVRDTAEEAASEAAGEIDGNAIWAEIEDRVADAAAESARSVIRDDLVVTVDLI